MLVGGLIFRLLTLGIDTIPVHGATQAVERGAGHFFEHYAVFALSEFAILGFVMLPLLRHSRGLLAVAMIVLALLPFAFFGPSNDLLLRVSTPALTIMTILAMRLMTDPAIPSPNRRSLLAAVLLAGAATPFAEFWRACTWHRWQPDYTRTFIDVQKGRLPPHYIGRLDNPFLVAVLRPPQPVLPRQQRGARPP